MKAECKKFRYSNFNGKLFTTFFFVLLAFGFESLNAQLFKEISLQSKLSNTYNNNGVAIADYDKDGDLDIFVVSRWNPNTQQPVNSALFRNNNDGTFTNVTTEAWINSAFDYRGIPLPGMYGFGAKMSASWGDYNNDGYPDLFLAGAFHNKLYRNNQHGTFSNVTAPSGIPETNNCYSTSALWFDINNDTWLDLYLTSIFSCDGSFYLNNGDGSFTNATEDTGLGGSGKASWMSIPWDINADGYQDIYISRDFDLANEMFVNNTGDSLKNKAEYYGIEDEWKDGMGVALADFDNDELPDLYITNINESSLYRNKGNGTFLNVAESMGVEKTGWAWGCQFEDFDHDLDLDLMVLNGFGAKEGNRYYENQLDTGELKFVDRASDYTMDEPSWSNSLATFDYDNDGDLDILISRTEDHLEFFENQTVENSRDDGNNWVQFLLEGTSSNRDAIGSTVKVKVGDEVLTRYYNGSSLMGQSLKPVHFGLGNYTEIDEVTIVWPNGESETYNYIPINSFVHITEVVGYEIVELSSHKIPGCTDPNSCNYNPDATYNNGTCTYLDSKAITGPLSAGILTEQTYSYPYTTGSAYQWSVSNGHIISGQGESIITVKWGIAEKGEITVTEINECVSQPVKIEVALNVDKAPDNVSVARMWNEVLLDAIRRDYARPTIHARNLFHTSIALYDAWAIFDETAETYLIGKKLPNYENEFEGFQTDKDIDEAIRATMSFAAYKLLSYRFENSPNHETTQTKFDALMNLLGYNSLYSSQNYQLGIPEALGNFIGQSIIDYGHTDRANEDEKYANIYYEPVNEPLVPELPGNPDLADPNRWQPLQLQVFIDQSGNVTSESTPSFLSPEWGNVDPFCLKKADSELYSRNGNPYLVYLDPGAPPKLNERRVSDSGMDLYKWNFILVSIWSSHLDPFDGVEWDISPAGIGNISIDDLPLQMEDYNQFYDLLKGGDTGTGRTTNPVTGQPYKEQIVPRGDYARVLAEFWADGPDSETPPGHWFVLLNYVSDHSGFVRKFKGNGDIMDPLEWDVKAYFTLGGAMHDAAITAWAIKGWYDYIRPISAIRYLADMGQCSDPEKPGYNEKGIPLIEGYIELVEEGDTLAGEGNKNVGKIKVKAWKGHSYIINTETDQAGVDWILAEKWWPYQRPSFVTPPFAGFISGHSTYSRTAAEILTQLTGSEYFPGGMGEFVAAKNEFLVFEEGPSQDVVLQWATYRDASDQCSLSRIWGGIHPPCDDIPGRLAGAKIGLEAFALAEKYFNGQVTALELPDVELQTRIYPIPTKDNILYITNSKIDQDFQLYDIKGALIGIEVLDFMPSSKTTKIVLGQIDKGMYILRSGERAWKIIVE